MWSLGCIYAELLFAALDLKTDSQSIRPIFHGNSCYPLSPKKQKEDNGIKDDTISTRD